LEDNPTLNRYLPDLKIPVEILEDIKAKCLFVMTQEQEANFLSSKENIQKMKDHKITIKK
jgi:hypothetical protein